MKYFATLFSSLFIGTLLCTAQVESGKPAPDFEAKDINGKTHKLSDYQGKVVVLENINLDCPFVQNHYESGAMQELQSEATGKGVVWLLISSVSKKSDSYLKPARVKKEMSDQKIKATAWLDDSDGKIGKAYGMKTTPHLFVINKEGKVVYQGAIDNKPATEGDPRQAKNYVREAVNKTVAGEKVEVAQTKPYGCGIKYAR
ncbi:MAG: thioredoxin family protein [Verrucomicrobia bacterium]|nr:thioredoxin family protein [Verrucomicrobiota bacterium]